MTGPEPPRIRVLSRHDPASRLTGGGRWRVLDTAPPAAVPLRWVLGVLVIGAAAGLAYALLALPPEVEGLRGAVAERMPESGVSHPVTAVLLNFRGYDTWLELAVLLLALVAAWSLSLTPPGPEPAPGPVLDRLTQLILPLMVLVAGYLLWVGALAPGGAFQAGAVLGAAGVLLLLDGWRLPRALVGWPLRLALVLGVAVFAAVGVGVMWGSRAFLQYPSAAAGALILLIEAAATLAIGVTLAALFHGGRPEDER